MKTGNIVEPDASPTHESKAKPSEAEGFYHPVETESAPGENTANSAGKSAQLSWEASEYVDHEKPGGWYVLLVGVTVIVAGIAFLITGGDWVTTIVVVIAAVLFGVVAARRPRTLSYTIDAHGVTIGNKLYPYSDIKTFSLITDTPLHSIQLLPLKRFMPPIGVYFPPEQEDKIIETLGGFIPYEQKGLDPFDRLMTRIRF